MRVWCWRRVTVVLLKVHLLLHVRVGQPRGLLLLVKVAGLEQLLWLLLSHLMLQVLLRVLLEKPRVLLEMLVLVTWSLLEVSRRIVAALGVVVHHRRSMSSRLLLIVCRRVG